jgi:hypothetical protein
MNFIFFKAMQFQWCVAGDFCRLRESRHAALIQGSTMKAKGKV